MIKVRGLAGCKAVFFIGCFVGLAFRAKIAILREIAAKNSFCFCHLKALPLRLPRREAAFDGCYRLVWHSVREQRFHKGSRVLGEAAQPKALGRPAIKTAYLGIAQALCYRETKALLPHLCPF